MDKANTFKLGKLVLSTGDVFYGKIGCWQSSPISGEIVFNTGMMGYVESITDPSYFSQLLVFSYPLIGNYGVNKEDYESSHIQVAGIITSEIMPSIPERKNLDFLTWCYNEKIPFITDIDTRSLIKIIRNGCNVTAVITEANDAIDLNLLKIESRVNLNNVSISSPQEYGQGIKKIIVIDCGIKKSLLEELKKFPCIIKCVPFNYDFTTEPFDAVFISNGPGDPRDYIETIYVIKKILSLNKPVFGVCLGIQLIALASGASIYKMNFGHRGQNQPCQLEGTQQCYLTSQNHGYSILESSLSEEWSIMFRNINDYTTEGIQHKTKPFFAVQFHPEGNPGPADTNWLFNKFWDSIEK